MTNTAPVSEMRFVLDHVLGADRLAATTMFAEAGQETVEAILTDWLAGRSPLREPCLGAGGAVSDTG